MDGLDVLKQIRTRGFPPAVVVITADGSLNRAVEAMREGALDFLVKPFNADRLLITLGNVLERRRLNSMVESLSHGGENGGANGKAKIEPLHVTEGMRSNRRSAPATAMSSAPRPCCRSAPPPSTASSPIGRTCPMARPPC